MTLLISTVKKEVRYHEVNISSTAISMYSPNDAVSSDNNDGDGDDMLSFLLSNWMAIQ